MVRLLIHWEIGRLAVDASDERGVVDVGHRRLRVGVADLGIRVSVRTDKVATRLMGDATGGCDLQDVTSLAVHAGIGPGPCGGNLDRLSPGAGAIQLQAEEDPYRNSWGDG